MALSGYERQKRLRARKRAGHVVMTIEVEPNALADILIEAGYLPAWDANDRDAVRAALEQAIAAWSDAA